MKAWSGILRMEPTMRISIGVIIALILIFFWWRQDHPNDVAPMKTGENASPAISRWVA
jgi:hypothetical protein